jgi:hypothetical protein
VTELRDARHAPFFYITVAASSVLRSSYRGKRLTTARAIYDALAEVANEARSSEFAVSRQYVARYAGVSDRTIDAYGREFVKLGLLEIEHRRDGEVHLPNIWRLVEPEGWRSQTQGGSEAKDPTVAKPNAGGVAKPNAGGWRSQTHPFKEVRLKKEEKKGDPPEKTRDFSHFDRAMRR